MRGTIVFLVLVLVLVSSCLQACDADLVACFQKLLFFFSLFLFVSPSSSLSLYNYRYILCPECYDSVPESSKVLDPDPIKLLNSVSDELTEVRNFSLFWTILFLRTFDTHFCLLISSTFVQIF